MGGRRQQERTNVSGLHVMNGKSMFGGSDGTLLVGGQVRLGSCSDSECRITRNDASWTTGNVTLSVIVQALEPCSNGASKAAARRHCGNPRPATELRQFGGIVLCPWTPQCMSVFVSAGVSGCQRLGVSWLVAERQHPSTKLTVGCISALVWDGLGNLLNA